MKIYSRLVIASAFLPAVVVQAQSLGGQASQAAVGAPQRYTPTLLSQPPQLSPARIAALQQQLQNTHLAPPMGPQVQAIAGPEGLPETQPAAPALAPGDAVIQWGCTDGTQLACQYGSPASSINEPSVATSGANVFYTANWFAAQAYDGGGYGGIGFSFIDPFADFPDFCCDQDVIADPGRDMFLWYRQGVYDSTSGQSQFLLGVSSDGGQSFCTYSYRPVDLNSSFTTRWWDYPRLALSNNYLYIMTNIFLGSGAYDRTVVLRWPLDDLQACAGFGFNYMNGTTTGWEGPVQGATTVMYFGGHRGTNNSFTVWRWPENSTNFTSSTVAIPAFTFQNGNSSCQVGGLNPCSRGDSRILGGWVRRGNTQHSGTQVNEIGFMWHGHEGGGFAYPYIEAVTLREDTMAVTGRPLIWNPGIAFQYPFVSPNARGDLGVTLTMMGNGTFPAALFAIDDEFNGPPPGWGLIGLRFGDTSAGAWGDYVRNRPAWPGGFGWASSGHTIQAGSVESGYWVISRQRDTPNVLRYIQAP